MPIPVDELTTLAVYYEVAECMDPVMGLRVSSKVFLGQDDESGAYWFAYLQDYARHKRFGEELKRIVHRPIKHPESGEEVIAMYAEEELVEAVEAHLTDLQEERVASADSDDDEDEDEDDEEAGESGDQDPDVDTDENEDPVEPLGGAGADEGD